MEMGCEEIEKVSALAPKARTPAERDFPVVNVWGGLTAKGAHTSHARHEHTCRHQVYNPGHHLAHCPAIMSNEGPEFKNEDVKEKLEGKSEPYPSSIECILTKSQRKSSRWTW